MTIELQSPTSMSPVVLKGGRGLLFPPPSLPLMARPGRFMSGKFVFMNIAYGKLMFLTVYPSPTGLSAIWPVAEPLVLGA